MLVLFLDGERFWAIYNDQPAEVKDLQKNCLENWTAHKSNFFCATSKKPEVEVVGSQEAPISLASWSGVEQKHPGLNIGGHKIHLPEWYWNHVTPPFLLASTYCNLRVHLDFLL